MKVEAWTGALPEEALRKLELRQWQDEVEAFAGLLDEHHYLGCPHARVRHLSQVVLYEGKVVALLIWKTGSRKLAGRESYVGWDARTRQKRLGWVVQNSRFLLIPKARPSNLASRVLGLSLKAMPQAWEERFGKRPLLAETFVDPDNYKGTCYQAAGWIRLGQTKGYARVSAPEYYQAADRRPA